MYLYWPRKYIVANKVDISILGCKQEQSLQFRNEIMSEISHTFDMDT